MRALGKQLHGRSRFVKQWLQRWLSSPGDAALRSLPSSGRPRKLAYPETVALLHNPQSKSSLRAAAARSHTSVVRNAVEQEYICPRRALIGMAQTQGNERQDVDS